MTAFFRTARARASTLFFAFALFGARPALAEWQCPVGVEPLGENHTGVACVWIDDTVEDDGGYDQNEDGGGVAPPLSHYSAAEWQAFVDAAARQDRAAAAARSDRPEFAALRKGVWDFSESAPGGAKHFCVASFLTLRGGVMLMNVSGKDGGAFVGFYGTGIPPLKTPAKVLVSLTQSGSTQTVHAFQTSFPLAKSLGMYLFAVPGTHALLDAMQDTQDYSVARDGLVAVDGELHDGLKARDWLRDCVAR